MSTQEMAYVRKAHSYANVRIRNPYAILRNLHIGNLYGISRSTESRNSILPLLFSPRFATNAPSLVCTPLRNVTDCCAGRGFLISSPHISTMRMES